jgi:hypothetical protein
MMNPNNEPAIIARNIENMPPEVFLVFAFVRADSTFQKEETHTVVV